MGRGPRTPPMLEVRQMFEPTRLAAACLEAAYARIVPTPWRRARGAPELHRTNVTSQERYERTVAPAQEACHG
jgi:hypothetical protein